MVRSGKTRPISSRIRASRTEMVVWLLLFILVVLAGILLTYWMFSEDSRMGPAKPQKYTLLSRARVIPTGPAPTINTWVFIAGHPTQQATRAATTI